MTNARSFCFNRKSDKIAIIAPASACEEASVLLRKACELLESYSFTCQYEQDIFAANTPLGYFSASKEIRARQLLKALKDPQIKIIWAFRGGYGSSEFIFDFINFPSESTAPKIMIGFSDITALLLLFQQKFNMPALHASVITSITDLQAEMLPRIIDVLTGKETTFLLTPLNLLATNLNIPIETVITGGNLAVICHLIGSDLKLDTENKIIFLEDVNEKGYQIHRYLLQMKHAGLFNKAKAVIFGDFSKSDDYLSLSIKQFCIEHLKISAFQTTGIGHTSINLPIVVGGNTIIANNIMTIHSPFALI